MGEQTEVFAMYKHLIPVFLSVLFISSSAFAKDLVVIIKQECEEHSDRSMPVIVLIKITCKGTVKNIGDKDVRGVVVKFTPSLPKDMTEALIASIRSEFQKAIDKLKSLNTEDSNLTPELRSVIAGLDISNLETLLKNLPAPKATDSSIKYLPSKEVASFAVTWGVMSIERKGEGLAESIILNIAMTEFLRKPDFLPMMIFNRSVIEESIELGALKTEISYDLVE